MININKTKHIGCFLHSFLKARIFLDTMYMRYLKHKIGWKKASQQIFNQRYIMEQMNEVMIIHTMENLQLASDLSNSQLLDPTDT